MAARGVRKSIANAILAGIGLGSVEPEAASSTRPISRAERSISVMSSRSHGMEQPDDDIEPVKSRPASRAHRERPIASVPTEAPPTVHRPHTPGPKQAPQTSPPDDDGLEPFDIASARDIDDLVRDMLPWFDGKESEDNWSKREKNTILFRRLTRGNAPHDFSHTYISAVKTLLDGIFKVVNSLRTTMSSNGSLLIQDIARICGPKIDPMVEIIMQNLMKLCSALKKIAAHNGNMAVDAVIRNVSFSIRLLQHVSFATQDKNVGVRLFASGWLKSLIIKQAHHKSSVEHGGGVELIEKSIMKGLADPNPGVREATRSTFWTFYSVWPERANVIADTLDPKSRTLLEKDASNPNPPSKNASALPAKSPAKSRTALQEAIAARKKAQVPVQSEFLQPAFADAKPSAPGSKATRSVPTGAPLSSLSSAPMRPGMKPRRAELSRPATADPYARRPESRTQTHSTQSIRQGTTSPRAVRSKTSTPTSKAPLSAPRTRPNEPPQAATTKGRPKKLDLSKSKSHNDLMAASRARSDSNESLKNQLSTKTPRQENYLSPSEGQHSPASISLESPQLRASEPLLYSAPHGPHANSVPVEEPEPMVLEESIPSASEPYIAERDVAVSPAAMSPAPMSPAPIHSDLTFGPGPESVANTQPGSMAIYEDPTTPTAVETQTPGYAASVGGFTPSQSPSRSNQYEHGEAEAQTISEDISASQVASAKKPLPELIPTQESTISVGVRTPSPTRRAPLQSNPSPTRRVVQPAASNIMDMEGVLPQEPHAGANGNGGNNENATPRMTKTVDFPAVPRSVAKPSALEEVTANEPSPRSPEARQKLYESTSQSTLSQSTFSQSTLSQSTLSEDTTRPTRKWVDRHRSPSPRSKDPVNAKEMIHRGLARILSRTMEPLGYRKLQGLIQYHGDKIVPQTQDYNAMLEALLMELEATPTSRKDHDVKTQVLATIRSMLLRTREHFHPYDTRAMAAIIRARRHYESTSHFVTCLEEVGDKLVFLTLPETAIAGVLQGLHLGQEAENDGDTYRSTIMGLSTIQQALSRPGVEIDDELLARIGAVVMQELGHPRPGVRKNATELCTFLNITFGSERVQKVTQPPREGSLNLLTYFMARRTQ